MFRSFRLGKLFGIGIYFHWSFLLVPAGVFVLNLAQGEVGAAFSLAAFVLAVFGCVLLHELGHALMARHFGIATRDITLYPIGGVARLTRMSERPWEEFWIAIAGPAVNVAIALAGAGLLTTLVAGEWLWYGRDSLQPVALGSFLFQLTLANLFLVLFNLLPAFPMDGGRVLRALLAGRLGFLRATEIAAAIGLVMSGLFVVVGIVSLVLALLNIPFLSPMLILVGVFVLFMGQMELAGVRSREAARRLQPLDVLPAEEPLLDVIPASPTSHFSGFIWDSRTGAWVLWHEGRAVHSIGLEPE